jgi:hypothetical protein
MNNRLRHFITAYARVRQSHKVFLNFEIDERKREHNISSHF